SLVFPLLYLSLCIASASISLLSPLLVGMESNQPNAMGCGGKGRFRRICVFCGSRSGNNPSFGEAAVDLGKQLVRPLSHPSREEDRLGLWWRKRRADGFDIQDCPQWWLSCARVRSHVIPTSVLPSEVKSHRSPLLFATYY
ncbi:hypothetical protein BHM03_00038027, partial [Ensete ventricosum]